MILEYGERQLCLAVDSLRLVHVYHAVFVHYEQLVIVRVEFTVDGIRGVLYLQYLGHGLVVRPFRRSFAFYFVIVEEFAMLF